MQQPNWIFVTVIGAIVGAIVSQYWMIIFFPLKLLRKDPFRGDWYDYHFTFMHGKRFLAQSMVSVSRGFLVDRSIRVQDQDIVRYDGDVDLNRKDGLAYKGSAKVEGPHIVIRLHATSHEEVLVFRLINRLPSNAAMIPGIWMSFDHDRNPTAGIMILSREKIATADAIHMLVGVSRTERGAVQVPLSERARRKVVT